MAIKFKRSETPGLIPSPTDLQVGEIAINVADGIIFTKDTGGSIEVLADNTANNTSLEAVVAIGENPPTLNLNSGKLWWDTNTGRLMIYYADGSSSQWIEASPSAAGPANPTVSATPSYLNLNDINQNVPNPAPGDEVWVTSIE